AFHAPAVSGLRGRLSLGRPLPARRAVATGSDSPEWCARLSCARDLKETERCTVDRSRSACRPLPVCRFHKTDTSDRRTDVYGIAQPNCIARLVHKIYWRGGGARSYRADSSPAPAHSAGSDAASGYRPGNYHDRCNVVYMGCGRPGAGIISDGGRIAIAAFVTYGRSSDRVSEQLVP